MIFGVTCLYINGFLLKYTHIQRLTIIFNLSDKHLFFHFIQSDNIYFILITIFPV